MERFKGLSGVPLSKVRDEFLKGLLHPDTDAKRYINMYQQAGLFNKLFPNIQIHGEVPPEFASRKDKPLALAWLLQDNSIEAVGQALSANRGDEETGWNSQDKRAVLFLLALKEYTPEALQQAQSAMKGSGLSNSQIRDWVDMFNITDARGVKRNRRPVWASNVRNLSNAEPPKEAEPQNQTFEAL
jgi:hypothetical protein